MKQEINFSGFTAVPSDYDCPDGNLAAAINVIPEDGALRPVLSPKTVLNLGSDKTVIYIHKNTGYTNYVLKYTNGTIGTIDADGKTQESILTLSNDETLTDIIGIGNILVISTNQNIHFLSFKKGEGYTYLGNQLPEVKMQFALESEVRSAEHTTSLTFSEYQSSENTYKFQEQKNVSAKYASSDLHPSRKDPRSYPGFMSEVFTLNLGLEEGIEYAFKVTGYKLTGITLYGSTKSNTEVADDYSSFEKIAWIEGGGAYYKAKTTKKYASYIFEAYRQPYASQGEFNVTLQVYKGFSHTVSGKVIEYNSDNYSAVFAAVNKFVMNNGTNDDRFVFPFFVRYALRLTDGSYARISAPILLVPNSGYAPFISFAEGQKYLSLYAFFARLQYTFLNGIDEKWKDIVSGVDIFVSQQAYPYNQGDAFDDSNNLLEYAFINSDINEMEGTDFGYCKPVNISSTSTCAYSKHDLYDLANKVFEFGKITDDKTQWNIVKIAPADDQMEKIQKLSNFYLLHSFSFDEVKATVDDFEDPVYSPLDFAKGNLKALVNRQTLTDDSLSQCRFFNAHLVNYNSRLHLFNFSLQHPTPATPAAMTGHLYRSKNDYGTLQSVHVYIHPSQGERIVAYNMADGAEEYSEHCPWFFYPHNNAYKAVLTYKRTVTTKISDTITATTTEYPIVYLDLKQHELLNGAFWMADNLNDDDIFIFNIADTPETITVSDTSEYPASVLQSQATLPFAFSDTMLNTLPVSRIYDMSSAAKALSQGQFGQFPLYAFSAEGVWALEVSTTGTYSARQPITRDVCINAEGLTQLDSSVLFPTDRGIMLLSGSQTVCISDAINSEYPFDATTLQGFSKLHDMLGHTPSTDKCLPTLPFKEFLKQCRMAYDYVHQRVIVYAPSITYAYVYSLKTQQWGMTFTNIVSHLNSYPEALAMTNEGALVNFSTPEETATKCLYLTRPLKLELPDTLKTVDTVIQRGFFKKGHVTTVLYGSRDLINWHLVWSSKDHYLRGFRGTSYKYFRIASVATLNPDESISSASVQFTPKQDNQLR